MGSPVHRCCATASQQAPYWACRQSSQTSSCCELPAEGPTAVRPAPGLALAQAPRHQQQLWAQPLGRVRAVQQAPTEGL